MRVLKNELVQRFPNHLYLFLFSIISIFMVSQREQFLIDSNSSELVFDLLELENIPDRDFKPSIGTLFGKSFILIALETMQQYYSISRTIILSKIKNVFIEIFDITDNELKI